MVVFTLFSLHTNTFRKDAVESKRWFESLVKPLFKPLFKLLFKLLFKPLLKSLSKPLFKPQGKKIRAIGNSQHWLLG